MNRYLAFISYRHSDRAQRVSLLLRKGLESFHLTKDTGIPKRRRVFRDTDELPTSTDLGTDIENALRDSGWLIALCSEEYKASKWCMREINDYIAMGRKDRIIPVLLSGTPEEALPAEIADLPVIMDLREAEDRALSGQVKAKLPLIFSHMTGIDSGKIAAGERKYKMITAAGVVAAIAAAVLGFSFYAMATADRISKNNLEIEEATNKAEEAEQEAIRERNEALLKQSGYYTQQAWKAISQENDLQAIELALRALPADLHGDEPVNIEAVSALRMALSMPSRPKTSYTLLYETETDFDIRGWMSLNAEGLLLTDGLYGPTEHYLNYETGEITEAEGSVRKKALESGYSRSYAAQSGSPSRSLYFGPEKQMHEGAGFPEIDFTLSGKPFFADHVCEGHYSYLFVAWLESPMEGQESRTALFYMKEPEAIAELELDGNPVSVSFSAGSSRVAVSDEAGTLRIFDTTTGKLCAVPEGSYTYVNYPDSTSRLFAVTSDGKAVLFDTSTWEKEYVIEAPSPIKQILYCPERGYVLACCADGFRIYNWEDGELLVETVTADEPQFAVWGGFDENLYIHDGNTVVLIFDRKVEVYTLETKTDTSVTDYMPLYRPGVENSCSTAFYSQDGRNVFQQSYHGDISKWDAQTAQFLWENESDWEIQGNVHTDSVLSRDGSAVWRSADNSLGYDRIDAETGKTIYTTDWQEPGGRPVMPIESPDCSLALAQTQYGNENVIFNSDTGEKLWSTDNISYACFSADSQKLYALQHCFHETDYDSELIYRCFDARTGEILKEELLLDLDNNTSCSVTIDESSALAAVILNDRYSYKQNEREYRIIMIDLKDGKMISDTDLTVDGSLSLYFSYTGETVLDWENEEKEEFLRRIDREGNPGPLLSGDSEEGRRLKVTEDNHIFFAGDEAYYENKSGIGVGIWESLLTRVEDGAVLMDFSQPSYIEMAAAPDGSSICIFGYYHTPMLILASDADTLVEKAKKRLEGEGG